MRRRADLALLWVTIIWGTTFAVVDQAVASFPALALIFLRFGFGSVVLLPMLWRPSPRLWLNRRTVVVGIGLGVLLFVGFATQTFGIKYTSPSRAGFITGLNVLLVPIFGALLGKRPGFQLIIGILLAMLGLLILTWGCQWSAFGCSVAEQGGGSLVGDALVLVCAAAFAAYIVAVDRWALAIPPGPLNVVQLLTVTALAGVATMLQRVVVVWNDPNVWLAAAYLGVVATGLVFWMYLWGQRHMSPTRAALIFALEPVFAALFAWWWVADRPTLATWVGGGLMVLAIIITELPLPGRTPQLVPEA